MDVIKNVKTHAYATSPLKASKPWNWTHIILITIWHHVRYHVPHAQNRVYYLLKRRKFPNRLELGIVFRFVAGSLEISVSGTWKIKSD